jgi:hypothetical protein
MIVVGIDTLETAGTNQLAREIVRRLADRLRCISIVRHQLFFDPRVPYTSKNGSASLCFQDADIPREALVDAIRHIVQEWYVEGSDPGLAVTFEAIPEAITAFGERCKREVVPQNEARQLAMQHGIHLEGLGGTEGGVIGSLAALGLIVTGNDGRIVQWRTWPDDLGGLTHVDSVLERGVQVRERTAGDPVTSGTIDLGKKLRPNLVGGQAVLWVRRGETDEADWVALKIE